METYIQDFRRDPELGTVTTNDHYFLRRLDSERGIHAPSFCRSADAVAAF